VDFEQIVEETEKLIRPELQRRCEALATDNQFTNAHVGSIRHAGCLHTIGLSCHPVASSSPDDTFSIHVNIFDVEGISMRGFVGWYQPFIVGKLPGYTIREGMTRPFRFNPGETLADFILLLPSLYVAFERGRRRGCPPRAIRRLWNRIFLAER